MRRASPAPGREFVTMHDVHAGGMSARAEKDGVSGVRVSSMWVMQAVSPLR